MKKQKKCSGIRLTALAAALGIAAGLAPVRAQASPPHGAGCLIKPREERQVSVFSCGLSAEELPSSVDLTDSFPSPGDQGTQNSCVAWSAGYAYKTHQEKLDHRWDNTDSTSRRFSPSYIYNQIHVNGDGGAYLEDALDLLIEQGVCPLSDMPYDPYNYTTQPTAVQRQKAYPHRSISYQYIEASDSVSMKYALSQNDGVIVSLPIYPDLDNLSESNPVYDTISGASRGYHTVCLIGYDDETQAFRFINSWGTGWGMGGYGYLAYSAMEPLDAWGYVMTDYQENTLPPVTNLQYDADLAQYTWDSASGSYEICINGESRLTNTNHASQTFALNTPYQAKVRSVDESTDSYGEWAVHNAYCGMYGDVNKDGRISKEDVYTIIDEIFGYFLHDDIQKAMADINQDDAISYHDIVLIDNYIKGNQNSIAGNKVIIQNVISYLYGDINMDGAINGDDSQMIQDYTYGLVVLSDMQSILADVDANGEIDAFDALSIQRYFLGQLTSFPAGKYASFHET